MTEQQLALLKKIGIDYDPSRKCTAEENIEIEDKVGDYLVLHCMDEDYEPNEEGLICESILDMIDNL